MFFGKLLEAYIQEVDFQGLSAVKHATDNLQIKGMIKKNCIAIAQENSSSNVLFILCLSNSVHGF
jgi:hypothetical protein